MKLSALAENLQQNYPGISLDIQSLSSGKIIDKIQAHELDGGYIFGDVPNDFVGLTVAEQRITTVAPMLFDVGSILTQADLETHQWITMGEYCPFDHLLKAKLCFDFPR